MSTGWAVSSPPARRGRGEGPADTAPRLGSRPSGLLLVPAPDGAYGSRPPRRRLAPCSSSARSLDGTASPPTRAAGSAGPTNGQAGQDRRAPELADSSPAVYA